MVIKRFAKTKTKWKILLVNYYLNYYLNYYFNYYFNYYINYYFIYYIVNYYYLKKIILSSMTFLQQVITFSEFLHATL